MERYEVLICIGKDVVATMEVSAHNESEAQMKATKAIIIKTKKAYGGTGKKPTAKNNRTNR